MPSSPRYLAPSSASSIEWRYSSPFSAPASTTLPSSNRHRAPDHGRRDAEVDAAVGRVLDWAGEDLPAGHVVPPIAVQELAPLNGEREVRLRSHYPHLPRLLQPLDEPALLLCLLPPEAHRVVLVERHRLEDELLVRLEPHLGLLRQRLRREERQRPSILSQYEVLHRLVPLGESPLLLRVHLRQSPCILRCHDRDGSVGALVDGACDRRRLFVVDVLGVFEEELLEALQSDLGDGDGARLEEPGVDLFDQGLRRRPAGEDDLFPLNSFDRIVDQNPRQLSQPFVSHTTHSSSRL